MYQFPISLQRGECLLWQSSGALCVVFISLFDSVLSFFSQHLTVPDRIFSFEIVSLEML